MAGARAPTSACGLVIKKKNNNNDTPQQSSDGSCILISEPFARGSYDTFFSGRDRLKKKKMFSTIFTIVSPLPSPAAAAAAAECSVRTFRRARSRVRHPVRVFLGSLSQTGSITAKIADHPSKKNPVSNGTSNSSIELP